MCASCGCADEAGWRIAGDPTHDHHHHPHDHDHDHDHHHHHHPHGDAPHVHARPALLPLEADLLARNDRLAQRNRQRLASSGIVALNLIGAPGAGKTALLEQTIAQLGGVPIAVIEGDQETENDAARIRATGCSVLQINTGAGCHLDAEMMERAIERLVPAAQSLLLVENVGNLVCPALFDLGERAKVVVMSVTEGEDKPLKYPHVFRAADVLVLTKIDLLPHLDFDVDRCVANVRRMQPAMRIFPVSARAGTGLDDWCGWLQASLLRAFSEAR